MNEDVARELYHGEERLNCAQAILKAFQPVTGMPDDIIASFKAFGGGRAEGGVCGALYAAQRFVSDPEALRELDKMFEVEGGSTLCRPIRQEGRLPCRECVGLAARFVKDNLKMKEMLIK
ncbi:MAG: C-GCAxxG-C-C family protein [Candidatus Ancaeobacter aquaticus]|nr:C-GCAxxG-C-C family protein [Candidatus Ancaeobacter aquaticus]